MRTSIVFVLSVFLLLSCTMSETRIYNLSLPAAEEMPNAGASAKVNVIVRAPRYLDQPYIAHRNSPYELQLSDTARWDASPADIVRGAVRDSLSSSGPFAVVGTSAVTPPGFYRCEVALHKFERFDRGNDSFGELDLEITLLSPGDRILYRNSLSKEMKLPDRSSLSLAKFLSEALSQGLDEAKVAIIKTLP